MKDYLIDTHAHINMLEMSINDTLNLLEEYNVGKLIIPSVDTSTMENVIETANLSKNFYAMVGMFPEEAKSYSAEVEDKMRFLAQNSKVKAVGEIGLDYYWDKSFINLQQDMLIKQIKMANDLNLPIVIHDREAHKDSFDILFEYNKSSKVLFHCFSGSVEFMQECVRQGWYIAIGGVVTFKNAVKIKEVAKKVPIENLVLETDTPYLTPVPFRGKTNHPAYVRYVAEEIAKLRDMPLLDVIGYTTENAERFFEI